MQRLTLTIAGIVFGLLLAWLLNANCPKARHHQDKKEIFSPCSVASVPSAAYSLVSLERRNAKMWTLKMHAELESELSALTEGTMDPETLVSEAAYELAMRLVRALKYLARRDY